jgi:hypothetical protein
MPARLSWLLIATSLAVSLSRQIIVRHHSSSITAFLEYWLIHFVGLVVFVVIAGTCIASFRKFWLKGTPKAERDWTTHETMFAVLMTVLVAAIFAVAISGATPTDDFDE